MYIYIYMCCCSLGGHEVPAKRVGNPCRLGINTAIKGAVTRAAGGRKQTCCHFDDRSEGGEEACSIPIV